MKGHLFIKCRDFFGIFGPLFLVALFAGDIVQLLLLQVSEIFDVVSHAHQIRDDPILTDGVGAVLYTLVNLEEFGILNGEVAINEILGGADG